MKTSVMQVIFKKARIFIQIETNKILVFFFIKFKSLKLSTTARRSTTIGEMTNILSTNAAQFEYCLFHLVSCFSAPLQLFIAVYMLWKYIGAATFAGMACMLFFLPLNAFFSRLGKKIRKEKYKLQDRRIKTINEMLNGIRVIKFYGWERSFQMIIEKVREKELRNLIKV